MSLSRTAGGLARLYGLALRLYPEGARREYAQEMRAVFNLKASAAAQDGSFALARLALREVRDLPGAIVRTHLDERRAKMKSAAGDDVRGGPLSAWKVAAVFLPFVLALLLTMDNTIHGIFFIVPVVALFGLTVATWIAGLVTAFPVWALPSLGVLLYFFYFYVFKLMAQAAVFLLVAVPLFDGWPEDLTLGILMLLVVALVTILIMAGILLGLLGLLPGLRRRVRKDWTVLSFLLYGLAIMPSFMNDEFHHLAGFQFASLLVLAAGAGLYLKAARRWQRILALVVPVVLSQVLIGVGLYQSYPLESWINPADPNQRIWESILFLDDPLAVLLFLPALVQLIPWREKPEPVLSEDPTLPASG